MIITNVNQDNEHLVHKFIYDNMKIKDIDYDILDNASILTTDNEIDAIISYEDFCKYGLIRYFIFKKEVSLEQLFILFNDLTQKATNKGFVSFLTIINDNDIQDVFKLLGFIPIDISNIYLDECQITETKFQKSIVLKYDLLTK